MKAIFFVTGLGLSLLLAPAAARADLPSDPYAPITPDEDRPRSKVGVGILVGGGVLDFVDDSLQSSTETGGSWTARAVIGTRSFLAIEGAYVGSANEIDALGIDSDALLTSHGGEGLLRLNLAVGPVQPYIFGGAAWKRYSLISDTLATSSIRRSDEVIESPFGGGIAFFGDGVVFDARFDYRPAFDEEMFAATSSGRVDLDHWTATARIGAEF
jgi:hypothetical protein